ncbi:type II secretion system protein [bacterium]|nr:type II secretion system protein [bacterium]
MIILYFDIAKKREKVVFRINHKNYLKGFTLAEVLITLVIIGVIAAITVPAIINNTNKQEYVSRLKKTYSTLSQATNSIIAEEGIPRADKGGWATDIYKVYDLYKPKLLNSKDCPNGSGCWNTGSIYNLSGEPYNDYDNSTLPKLVLSDGTLIFFRETDNTCGEYGCVWLWVDVNGVKKPNTWGKDMYQFLVTEKNGLHPRGCNRVPFDTRGHNATCQVLREGAINYY